MSFDFHRSPEAMVRCLISYIPCDKRVRNEVYSQFGTSPHVDTIREMRRARQAETRRTRRQVENRGEHPEDHIDFRVGTLVKPARGTPRMEPYTGPLTDALPVHSPVRKAEPRTFVTATDLIAAIADEFGFSVSEILSPDRHREIVLARRAIIYVLRERGNSFPQIGKRLERDHSSVLHNYRLFQSNASPEMRRIAAKYLGA